MFLNKTQVSAIGFRMVTPPVIAKPLLARLHLEHNTTIIARDLELKVAMLIPRDRNFSHDFNDPLRLECLAIRRRDKIVKPARGSALQRGNGMYFSARC